MVADACARAPEILTRRKAALMAVSARLLEVKTIDGNELDRLIEAAEQRNFEETARELAGA